MERSVEKENTWDLNLFDSSDALCVYSLANYSVAFEETQSNRVSDFRDFVCSLFQKAFWLLLYLIKKKQLQITEKKSNKQKNIK